MRKLVAFALLLLAVTGCYATPDGSNAPSAPAVEGAALLGEVSVSPTHTLYFYEGTDAEVLVAEALDIDVDRSVVQAHPLLRETGRFAELYMDLAGELADGRVYERLQMLDAQALSALASAGPEVPDVAGSLVSPGVVVSGESAELVEKDFWSEDADWFRVNMCNGCVGADGVRQNFGEPAHWPTCTSNPEVCLFAGAGTGWYERKSRNFNFTVQNFAWQGTVEMAAFLTNPTENCTWAQVVFTNCGAGGTRLLQHFLQPRQWLGVTSTNHSQSWSRRFVTNQPGNIGFKVDIF